ncbi:uncharacterized protein LOC135845716 isoform X2 [Planococcus citri]|uniref:uncharacterized protein LOC135845716 isoform X2 n=1 Tax=Planococcus citri TaxID=170843 RepID=UPI0031F7D342
MMDGMTTLESLMCHRIGWQTETYVKRAIEIVIRQNDQSTLKQLLATLSTNGKTITPCVTVARPIKQYYGYVDVFRQFPDGDYPHVIYAKIWRWPDVRFEELQCLPHCKFGFELKKASICVNPYHYERIEVPYSSISVSSTSTVEEQPERIRTVTFAVPEVTTFGSSNSSKTESVSSNASVTDTKESKTIEATSDQSSDQLLDMLTTSFDFPGLLPTTNDSTGSNSAHDNPEPEKTAELSTSNLDILDLDQNSIVSVPYPPSASQIKDSDTSSEPSVVNSPPSEPSVVNQLLDMDDSYSNGAGSARDRSESSASISSDDGFEIINYDMDVDELNAAESKTPSMTCSVADSQNTKKELELACSETTPRANDDYSTTSSAQNTWNDAGKLDEDESVKSFEDDVSIKLSLRRSKNVKKFVEAAKLTEEELPMSFGHFLADLNPTSPNLIPSEANGVKQRDSSDNSCAAENNVTSDMETENGDSKAISESVDEWKKKYEKLRDEHEKLKVAFIDAGFAATNEPTLKLRCKEMQKLMDGVKTQFESPSKSAGQYKRLRKIVDNGVDGFFTIASPPKSSSSTSHSSTSSSACSTLTSTLSSLLSPDTPYRRKIYAKTRVAKLKIPPFAPNCNVSSVTTPSSTATTQGTLAVPTTMSSTSTSTAAVSQCGPFYFTGLPSSSTQPAAVDQKTNAAGTATPRPTIPLELIPGPPKFSQKTVKLKDLMALSAAKDSKMLLSNVGNSLMAKQLNSEKQQQSAEVTGPSSSHQQPTAAPLNVPEQPKIKAEIMDEGEKPGDESIVDQLRAENYTLRVRVKSLEAQLEMQKQDEMEKMKHYTNNMREQYIQTVNRLTESNKPAAFGGRYDLTEDERFQFFMLREKVQKLEAELEEEKKKAQKNPLTPIPVVHIKNVEGSLNRVQTLKPILKKPSVLPIQIQSVNGPVTTTVLCNGKQYVVQPSTQSVPLTRIVRSQTIPATTSIIRNGTHYLQVNQSNTSTPLVKAVRLVEPSSHQQPKAGPSHAPEQPEVKEEKMDQSEKPADDSNEAQLQAEVDKLRIRVKSLEAQLEMQKQDEMEKMKSYTNSMREHYMQTVTRLNESNKELTEKLAVKEIEMANQIDPQEVTTLLDDKDREINNLNDHLLSLCALLTANEDEILQLKHEKRTLKRNSESEESDEEVSLKRRPDDQEKVESNQEPLAPQHVFDYLCSELEKSTMKTSEENKSEDGATNKEGTSSDNVPSNDNSAPSEPREINTLTTSIRDIEERERAMAARFSEVIAELEVMKITHDKTKTDLEARLKNGAKQYAKLYLKYDKLKKGNPPETDL